MMDPVQSETVIARSRKNSIQLASVSTGQVITHPSEALTIPTVSDILPFTGMRAG